MCYYEVCKVFSYGYQIFVVHEDISKFTLCMFNHSECLKLEKLSFAELCFQSFCTMVKLFREVIDSKVVRKFHI